MISALIDGEPFQYFAIGQTNFQGKEGTHKDAEDGALSQNPIEHGPVDSVLGCYGAYAPGQTREIYFYPSGRSPGTVYSIPETRGIPGAGIPGTVY